MTHYSLVRHMGDVDAYDCSTDDSRYLFSLLVIDETLRGVPGGILSFALSSSFGELMYQGY